MNKEAPTVGAESQGGTGHGWKDGVAKIVCMWEEQTKQEVTHNATDRRHDKQLHIQWVETRQTLNRSNW